MSTKTVLITGSNRSLGLEFAKYYVSQGWNVIGASRDLAKADALKALGLFKLVELDTSDEPSILNAAKELEGVPIDLLINNAGIFVRHDLLTTTNEELMHHFEVNSIGPFLVTRALIPNLKLAAAQHGRAIVASVSSQLGSNGLDNNKPGMFGGGNYYAYRSSKAALNRLNGSLAVDLKNDNITTIVMHPGYVSTEMSGFNGTVSTEDGVAGLSKIIAGLKPEDSGKFFEYEGGEMPWQTESNAIVDEIRCNSP